ncbi:MAG: DUF1801 domain-containing protein [Phycisphaerae bacterium]|nr:DUF1801 domain-containing protein [Phycisphaerae bacterium]
MQSKADTVERYLAELPDDRRAALQAVREVILANLDKGYAECMNYGMIGYVIPHSIYPPGYHCNPKLPLPMAGLASQKNYMSLYLITVYGEGTEGETWFRKAWAKSGKKLDMGKCCIRFKRVEDLALDVIGQAIRRVPVKTFIEYYERALLPHSKGARAKAGGSAAVAKPKPKARAAAGGSGSASKGTRAKKKPAGRAAGRAGTARARSR